MMGGGFGSGEPPMKPLTLACYLCGREFGTSSLTIHQKQCLRKRDASQQLLPPDVQTDPSDPPMLPVPRPDDFEDREELDAAIEEYNAEAMERFEESQPKCFCGRTFAPTSFETHQRSCRAGGGRTGAVNKTKRKVKSKMSVEEMGGAKPLVLGKEWDKKKLALVCYLCGRDFGTNSLEIHWKSCKRKRTAAQKKLEKAQRTKRPDPPALPTPTIKSTPEEFEEYNRCAMAVYQGVLPSCPRCNRTFADQERLAVHMRSCNAGGGGRGAGAGAGPSAEDKAEAARKRAEAEARRARAKEEREKARAAMKAAKEAKAQAKKDAQDAAKAQQAADAAAKEAADAEEARRAAEEAAAAEAAAREAAAGAAENEEDADEKAAREALREAQEAAERRRAAADAKFKADEAKRAAAEAARKAKEAADEAAFKKMQAASSGAGADGGRQKAGGGIKFLRRGDGKGAYNRTPIEKQKYIAKKRLEAFEQQGRFEAAGPDERIGKGYDKQLEDARRKAHLHGEDVEGMDEAEFDRAMGLGAGAGSRSRPGSAHSRTRGDPARPRTSSGTPRRRSDAGARHTGRGGGPAPRRPSTQQTGRARGPGSRRASAHSPVEGVGHGAHAEEHMPPISGAARRGSSSRRTGGAVTPPPRRASGGGKRGGGRLIKPDSDYFNSETEHGTPGSDYAHPSHTPSPTPPQFKAPTETPPDRLGSDYGYGDSGHPPARAGHDLDPDGFEEPSDEPDPYDDRGTPPARTTPPHAAAEERRTPSPTPMEGTHSHRLSPIETPKQPNPDADIPRPVSNHSKRRASLQRPLSPIDHGGSSVDRDTSPIVDPAMSMREPLRTSPVVHDGGEPAGEPAPEPEPVAASEPPQFPMTTTTIPARPGAAATEPVESSPPDPPSSSASAKSEEAAAAPPLAPYPPQERGFSESARNVGGAASGSAAGAGESSAPRPHSPIREPEAAAPPPAAAAPSADAAPPAAAPANPSAGGAKVAKFCFECGEGYPTDTAKFCFNCGTKRVGM